MRRSSLLLLALAACSGGDKGGDDTATDGGDAGGDTAGDDTGGSGDGGSGDGGATLDGEPWNRVFGGSGEDYAFTAEVFEDADGTPGVVVGGSTTTGTADGYADLMLLRLDTDGEEVWRRSYGEAWSQYGTAACAVPGGGFAVVGSGYAEATDSEDVFLVRTDADGEELWRAVLGDAGEDEAQGLLCLDDGGFLVVGQSMAEATTDYDAVAIRLDADGNTTWRQTFGGADQDWFRAAEPTDDGGFAIVGYTASSGEGETDAWLVRLDGDGAVLWERTYGGVNYDYAYDLAATDDGWVLAGATYSLSSSLYCLMWAVTTDGDGVQTGESTAGSTDTNDYFFGVLPDGEGGAWFTGTTARQTSGSVEAELVHLDADGEQVAWVDYAGDAFDALYGIVAAGDGGMVLAGATASWGAGQEDAWVIRTDADGAAPTEASR